MRRWRGAPWFRLRCIRRRAKQRSDLARRRHGAPWFRLRCVQRWAKQRRAERLMRRQWEQAAESTVAAISADRKRRRDGEHGCGRRCQRRRGSTTRQLMLIPSSIPSLSDFCMIPRLERIINFGSGGAIWCLGRFMGSRRIVVGQEYTVSIMAIDNEEEPFAGDRGGQ